MKNIYWQLFLFVWGHLFSTYTKYSEKLTFLTPWNEHVRVRIVCLSGGKKCSFFGKFCVRINWIIPIQECKLFSFFSYIIISWKKPLKFGFRVLKLTFGSNTPHEEISQKMTEKNQVWLNEGSNNVWALTFVVHHFEKLVTGDTLSC